MTTRQMSLFSVTDGAATSIAGPLGVPDIANFESLRFEVVGETVRARIWVRGAAEPNTWQLETTDSAVSQSGVLQVAVERLSGSLLHRAEIDVVEVTAR